MEDARVESRERTIRSRSFTSCRGRKGGKGEGGGVGGGKSACLFELKDPGGSVHTSTSFSGSGDDGVHATVNAAGADDGNVVAVV